MQLRPILSSLRHHRLTALLLVIQVACTCAIVCNVVFMIASRVERITLPTGIAEKKLSVITSDDIRKGDNPQAQQAADLGALRKIPGIISAVAVDGSLPLDQNDSSTWICATSAAMRKSNSEGYPGRGCAEPSIFRGAPGEISTLGLRLIEGRDFLPDEYVTPKPHAPDAPPAAIITRSLARYLYPGEDALGRSLYTDAGKPTLIVGIVATLLRPHLRKPAVDYFSVLWPVRPNYSYVTYVLRSAPQDRQRVLKAALAALDEINPDRVIWQKQTYQEIRHDYFRRDITMIGLLLASVAGLLFVTALGITGLASFWVQQRTKQIGIRRAVGATRGDILRYFQLENFLIVSVGVFVGLVLAVGLNLILMQHYGMQPLPWYYLLVSAIVLWLLGQLAVLNPALRAASVPPSTATRSV
jgi:putative ABC transport system permease protein